MTVEQELHERDLTKEALHDLTVRNDNLNLCKALQGLLIAMAEGARKGVGEDEEIEGALCIFIGTKNSHHLEFTGKFNPFAAYGAAVDSMFEVRALADNAKNDRIIKSFVGNLESQAAQVEKDATNPDVQ